MKSFRFALAIVGVASQALAVAAGCSSSSSASPNKDAGGTDGGDASSSTPEAGARTEAGADAASDATSAAEASGNAADGSGQEVLYANSGDSLGVFDLSLVDGTLTAQTPTAVPQIPQYGWFDSTFRHLYVGATTGSDNYYYAYTVDPMSGALTELGSPLLSPNGRVINLTLSPDDKYLLSVHNVTQKYSVFNIDSDSTIGTIVPQADGGDTNVGVYLHQVRVDPTGKYVTICDRGNDPTTVTTDAGPMTTPEAFGHLLVFSFSNGVLTPNQTIPFPMGVGPRHVDFHPTQPWVYLSAERGNRLIMYTFENGMLTQKFDVTSVANAADSMITDNTEAVNGQRAGAIKVDPSGKYLWITNRNNMTEPDPGPQLDAGADAAGAQDAALVDSGVQDAAVADAGGPVQVFAGAGENNVALFSIDQTTGEPTFVAAYDTHGIEPRTITVDPAHKFLIVGNQKQQFVRQGAALNTILPNIAVFQVDGEGHLTFVKTYDQTSGEVVWVGSTAIGEK
jgi:6-phosphogluconolactonase